MSISSKLVRRPMSPHGAGSGKEADECGLWSATAEAFAAMDRFTEEMAKAGVLVAGACLENSAQAKRIGAKVPAVRSSTGRSPRADR